MYSYLSKFLKLDWFFAPNSTMSLYCPNYAFLSNHFLTHTFSLLCILSLVLRVTFPPNHLNLSGNWNLPSDNFGNKM